MAKTNELIAAERAVVENERRLAFKEVISTLALCHRTLMALHHDQKVWDPKERLLKEINHIHTSILNLSELK